MIIQLKPIDVVPLQRPAYDNTRMANFASWFFDNRRALIKWWWQCNLALRAQGVAREQPDDFDLFCRCQHERETFTKALQP